MARTLQSVTYNVRTGKRPAFHGAKCLSNMSKKKTKALMFVCLVLFVAVWFYELFAARAERQVCKSTPHKRQCDGGPRRTSGQSCVVKVLADKLILMCYLVLC